MESIRRVWKVSRQSGKFPNSLESFWTVWLESIWTVWKVSGRTGKCPDSLESFLTVWKVSRESGNFLDSLLSFQTVWKDSRQSVKLPDRLKSFQTSWKVSRETGKFLDGLESFRIFFFWQDSDSLKQFTHFCICHENDLHTFGVHVVEKINALCPEFFCKSKSADRKVETF